MELNLESIMSNDYFKPLIVILALPIFEICCLECFFVSKLLRSEASMPQTASFFCSCHIIKPGKLTNLTQNQPKPDTTIIHANMGKHLFMLEKSFGLVVHCVALWSLLSLWGWLLLAPTPRCWPKTSQLSSKK